MDLTNMRIVDLTHRIVPDTPPRPVHIETVPAPHAVPGGQWYIMHKVAMALNHVGTHIEAPYHVRQEGQDVAEVPLEALCGPAVVLDLRFVAPGGVVSLDDMRRAADAAGGVRRGDIVLGRFDYDGAPGTSRNFTAEAIRYLVDAGMKLMGVDLGGIELPHDDPRAPFQYNHHQLLDNDICLIENAANLAALTQPRVTVFCLPAPIARLDSFPVRLIALEPR
ncbi:MAG: cyclase family protein [Chloroflexota bacterium]